METGLHHPVPTLRPPRSDQHRERGAMKRLAVGAVALVLLLAGCGTGVEDEKGWNKALERGYPCSELVDIARDLPSSIDPQQVVEDLRGAGCEPPSATTAKS